jgi:hypothetical protein
LKDGLDDLIVTKDYEKTLALRRPALKNRALDKEPLGHQL